MAITKCNQCGGIMKRKRHIEGSSIVGILSFILFIIGIIGFIGNPIAGSVILILALLLSKGGAKHNKIQECQNCGYYYPVKVKWYEFV